MITTMTTTTTTMTVGLELSEDGVTTTVIGSEKLPGPTLVTAWTCKNRCIQTSVHWCEIACVNAHNGQGYNFLHVLLYLYAIYIAYMYILNNKIFICTYLVHKTSDIFPSLHQNTRLHINIVLCTCTCTSLHTHDKYMYCAIQGIYCTLYNIILYRNIVLHARYIVIISDINFRVVQFFNKDQQFSIVCSSDSDIVVEDDSIGREWRRPAHHCTTFFRWTDT